MPNRFLFVAFALFLCSFTLASCRVGRYFIYNFADIRDHKKFSNHELTAPEKPGDFMAKGILGQFVFVNPAKNLIIVRLGRQSGNVNWPGVFVGLSRKY